MRLSASEWIYTRLLSPPPLRAAINFALRVIAAPSVRVGDATVVLDPEDPVISGALTLKLYERDEIAFFRKVLKPGHTVLDIGANVGLYTALAMQTVKQVVCVEPNPGSRSFLEQTIAANAGAPGSVHVIAAAAGEQAGVATLYSSPENHGDNRMYPHSEDAKRDEVPIVRLDDELVKLGIETIDVLKIDIQGFEAHAIAGVQELLRRSPNMFLMSEFWPTGMRTAGSSPEDYLAMLRDLGFSLQEMTKGGGLIPIDDSALIDRLQGRKYANIVGFKGEAVLT